MDGVGGEVPQGVVHPTHVPLHAEAQAAQIGGARDAWPGGGLLSDSENAGEALEGDFIQALQEVNGFQIFAAAKFIGNPFTGLSGVIQINHGSHSVHAQSVDVIFVQPEQGVGDQIIADFIAAVVIDESAPIELCALPRVRVLEEVSSIKLRQAVGVPREMGGSPVEDDSYSGVVTTIDEIHEVCGRPVAAGGGVIAEGLVAPGAIEGMLHDRKQFDVGISEFFYVW